MALKQLEPVIKQVGENTFAITPFPAMKAANLSGQLGAFLGPIIGSFAPLIGKVFNAQNSGNEQKSAGDGNSDSLMDTDVTEAASALSGLSTIDGDRLETLLRRLLLGGNITVRYADENGETRTEKLNEDIANELFCGDVQDMFVLAVHVIRLNFNGFFERLTARSGLDESALMKATRTIF